MAQNNISQSEETRVALKFVLLKIKRLCSDSYGECTYVENFDNVIKDIFGYERFGTKLQSCYDDRDIMVIVRKFNIKNLMMFCNNARIYNAIAELIGIDYRLEQIKKLHRKSIKKNKKKNKDLLKEEEYLKNLYKDAIKNITKRLGLSKASKSYKNQYRTLNEITSKRSNMFYSDDDDDDIGVFISSDRDDDDDEDDYRSNGNINFEEYLGNYVRKKNKTGRNRVNKVYDEEDEEDDDDEEEKSIDRLDSIEKSIYLLTSLVANNFEKIPNVQPETFIEEDEEDIYDDEDDSLGTLLGIPQMSTKPNKNDDLLSMKTTIGALEKAVSVIAESQSHLIRTNDKIMTYLSEVPVPEITEIPNNKEVITIVDKAYIEQEDIDYTEAEMRTFSSKELIDITNIDASVNTIAETVVAESVIPQKNTINLKGEPIHVVGVSRTIIDPII